MLVPIVVWMDCPGRAAEVLVLVEAGQELTMSLVSKVCDRGLPNNKIKDLTVRFVSSNMNEEPGDAPGDDGTQISWHRLGRGVFIQGCNLVCRGCPAQVGLCFKL